MRILLKRIFPQNFKDMFLYYFVVLRQPTVNHFLNVTQVLKLQVNEFSIFQGDIFMEIEIFFAFL